VLLLLDAWSSPEIVNVGSGEEVSIAGLARLVAEASGFRGRIEYDTTRPDGTPRKVLDSSRLRALGWRPEVSLAQGVHDTVRGYAHA
jgi:GDP-L-fucose synthase